jgi:hypothetical protein
MSSLVLAALLVPVLVLTALVVGCLAARRLAMSRSRNAFLYWLASGFAFAGALGAARTGIAGAQMDAAGMALAAASLPLWLLVRAVTARGARGDAPGGPVFASVRPTGLRGAAPRLTTRA